MRVWLWAPGLVRGLTKGYPPGLGRTYTAQRSQRSSTSGRVPKWDGGRPARTPWVPYGNAEVVSYPPQECRGHPRDRETRAGLAGHGHGAG